LKGGINDGPSVKKNYVKNEKTVESEKWYVRLWYKDQDDGRWKRMVEAVSMHKKAAEIHPLLIERYKRERGERVSRRTVDIELACLKHVFTKAVEWGQAAENPVRKVRLFKPRNERTTLGTGEVFADVVDLRKPK
jgi:hypothetical protein